MKRSERHHLKQNPVAQLAWELREITIGHSRQASLAASAVLVVALGGIGFYVWQVRRAAGADAMLAQAARTAETPIVPAGAAPDQPPAPGATTYPSEKARLEAVLPLYLSIADTYPSSDAATTALYQAANALAALGRADEAEQRYREVVARDEGGIYGQMARLGLADVQQAAGRFDSAIETYVSLSAAGDTRLPLDGVLLHLARTYARAGKTEDAVRTYTRIVEEFPQSVYVADAQDALSAIKKS